MWGADFDSGMVEEQAGPEGAALFLIADDVLVADPKMAHYRRIDASGQFKAARLYYGSRHSTGGRSCRPVIRENCPG